MRASRVRLKWCAVILALSVGGAEATEQEPIPESLQTATLAAEEKILRTLAAVAPAVVEDFRKATAALDANDYASAATGFALVLSAAPDFDPAIRRSGLALAMSGHRNEGLAQIEHAIELRRSTENLVALAAVIRRSADPDYRPTSEERGRIIALASEALLIADGDDFAAASLLAESAISQGDADNLRVAVARLLEHHPDVLQSHLYAAILAKYDGRSSVAEKEIREAGRLGLPTAIVNEFLTAKNDSQGDAWRWVRYAGVATAAWAGGLLLLFVLGKVLSAVTLRSIERDDPNATAIGAPRVIRTVYRRVVQFAGFYWFLSMPFVALLVVGLTGSLFYGFMMVRHIPIKLMLIIAFGALATVWALVCSLFVRIKDEDPGRAIGEDDAPALWRVVREVAGEVGTRPVDQIWLTAGSEVAVFERGARRARMTDTARRALIIGAGVLDGFGQNALRAVLAHEYGHFSHRDTAGGDVAIRVQRGIYKFVVALAQSGYAVWWNIGFHFARLFDFLYRRLSLGAIRLQEVLADRVAIQLYGLDAFREGLSHVVRRSVEFGAAVDQEIGAALESRRVLANIYTLGPIQDPQTRAAVDTAIQRALLAETTEDDSHPSPKDRFRLGERIVGKPPATGADDSLDAWQLFRNPEALKEELNAPLAERVAARVQVLQG